MITQYGCASIERKARIFNIQKYSIYDGPGIRTLIFFKGCPLRCQWCSNPEGIDYRYQIMYLEDLCSHCGRCAAVCPEQVHKFVEQRHVIDRTRDCRGCRKCEAVCAKQAIAVAGTEQTISELLTSIQQDAMFYLSSGGGVTLGGGEVTTQPEFAANLLMECKRLGLHTAIETCGYAKWESLLMVAEFTDLILFDIKQIDAELHYEFTGVRNERIIANLTELITRGFNVKIRMPLLKGINSQEHTIVKTLNFLQQFRDYDNFKGVDLLPYHKLGINKYKQLGLTYSLTAEVSLSEDDLRQLEQLIKSFDIEVAIIRH